MAIPVETKVRLLRLGAAAGTGAVAAAAQHFNSALGTAVVFGGGILGLLGALTMRGNIAEIGEGVANAAAASVGHLTVNRVLKGGVARRASMLVDSGGPRVSLLPSGRVEALIPQQESVTAGGYRSI